jgi:peptidyl-tRNA hydrolase, PTH1 family
MLIMKCTYIGLGNPGEKYKNTRHNAGRILLERIAIKNSVSGFDTINESKTIDVTFDIDSSKVVFVSPHVFMNNSGSTAKAYRDPETMLVIVYDDIDLPFGEIRLSYNKSGGSHNGVLSVVKQLGTQKFVTLRIGVSPINTLGEIMRPTGKGTVERFVLKDFSGDELNAFDELALRAEKVMLLLGTVGLQKTLSVYKTKV